MNEINTLIASKMKIYTPFSQRIIILLKSKIKEQSYGLFFGGRGIQNWYNITEFFHLLLR